MRPITATDLMNPKVLTVRDDLPLRDLAEFLLDNEITGAPVEDAEGRLVGVVSLVDLAEAALDEGAFGAPAAGGDEGDEAEGDLRVADIMTPEVQAVEEGASVSEVAMTMLKQHLHRLLVVRDGRPVGIISTSDLLGLLVEAEH